MLREDYIKKTGNDTLEKALADKNLRLIMKPAGSSVPPVARMVAGVARHQRRRLQEGRPADPGRCRPDHQHAARRPRRPLLRERHQGPSGGHRGHLTVDMRFVDLPQKSLDLLSKNGLKPSPMPVYFKGQPSPTKAVDLGTIDHRAQVAARRHRLSGDQDGGREQGRAREGASGVRRLRAGRRLEAGEQRYSAASGRGALLRRARLAQGRDPVSRNRRWAERIQHMNRSV